MFYCWRFCRNTNWFVTNGLYVSDFIEYASIFLKIGPDDVLILVGGDDMFDLLHFL